MRLPCGLKVAVVGAGFTRGQISKFAEMIACPDNDLHPGHAELAVVLVYYGSETVDQRFGDIPRSHAVCLGEHFSEATLDTFNLPDIELPVSRPGDEGRDDDDLRDEIDQWSVCFTGAQTLKCDPCTQREIRGFPAGHREKERPCMRTRRRPTRGPIFLLDMFLFDCWRMGFGCAYWGASPRGKSIRQNLSLERWSSPFWLAVPR